MNKTHEIPLARDVAMIRTPSAWPVRPYLPLTHETRVDLECPGLPLLGFLLDEPHPPHKVYVGCMFLADPATAAFESYDTPEAVVAAGWRVD